MESNFITVLMELVESGCQHLPQGMDLVFKQNIFLETQQSELIVILLEEL